MANRSVSFDVLAIDKASRALESVAREVTQLDERIDRAGGSIEVDAETAKASEKLRAIDSQLARLNAKALKVDADTGQAERQLQVLRAELERTTDADKQVQLTADISQVQAQLRRLAAEKVAIDVETAGAQAKIAAVKASLDGLGNRRATQVDVDAAGALGALARLGTQLRAAQTPVTIAVGFASVMNALAWVQRLAAGLTALGAVGVASGGVAAAAFSGIGDALDAMGEKAETGGAKATTSASAIRSATRQVEQAQRDLRDANANVTRSEEDLQAAQEDARRAVESLDDARRAAIRTLEDYEMRTKGMALSQESADLSIAEARQRLAEVERDGKASALERARAELNVREAIQRRNELEVEGKRLAEDKADADARGVEGSAQVVSAQDRIAEANKRVQDAQAALTKSHEQVSLAVQRLSDSQLALREAMTPQGGGGGTVIDQYAEAMAKLTPEGRKFVEFLKSLIDGPLKELQDTSQSKFLPGLQDGIKSFMGELDGANANVAKIATSMGDFFRDIGPSAGRAADAFLRLAGLGAETTFEGLADTVSGALDSFTEWANSQSATEIEADIREVGDAIVELKDMAVLTFRTIVAAWDTLKAATSLGGNIWSNPVEGLGDLYDAVRNVAEIIPGMSGRLPEASQLLKDLGGAGSVAVPQIDHVGTSADGVTSSLQRMQDAARNVAAEFANSEQANINYAAALDRTRDAAQRNGETISLNTDKGRDNRQALIDLADAANRVVEEMQNAGAPIDDVRSKFSSQRDELINVARQMGLTKTQAQQYIDKLLQIPASKTTTITANTASALANIRAVSQSISQLQDKTVNIRTVYSTGTVTNVKALSAGGRVPGTPSSVDSVPTILAQGEFVVRSSQASKYLPLLERINAGTTTPERLLASVPAQGGSGGGGLTIVVPVTITNAVIGNNDEIARVVSVAAKEGIERGYLNRNVLAGA